MIPLITSRGGKDERYEGDDVTDLSKSFPSFLSLLFDSIRSIATVHILSMLLRLSRQSV